MHERRWAVVRHPDEVPVSVHVTRREAVIAAREVAARDGGEVHVHDFTGALLRPDHPDLLP